MVLEACMICVDNSDHMANGDYAPTRLQAQRETANYIATRKINGNQESIVGILSMAGPRIELHASPCRNMGKIMTSLKQEVQLGGQSNFTSALKIAQLALKNRQNKKQHQRIILFVGSPVLEDTKNLIKLGKKLKKNNIAVDVINFGAENVENENVEKLESFIKQVNNSDNSHFLNAPPGPHNLSDVVLSSSIMNEGGAVAIGGGGSAGAGGANEIDPEMDPEMAMVMRMSIEEEKQRQARVAEASKKDAPESASTAAAAAAPMDEVEYEDEDELLAKAIALSMEADGGDIDMNALEEPAEESSAKAKPETSSEPALEGGDVAEAMLDADFINDLLDSVPGVDANDFEVDDILNQLAGEDKKDEKK